MLGCGPRDGAFALEALGGRLPLCLAAWLPSFCRPRVLAFLSAGTADYRPSTTLRHVGLWPTVAWQALAPLVAVLPGATSICNL